jgi:hypothetical protein
VEIDRAWRAFVEERSYNEGEKERAMDEQPKVPEKTWQQRIGEIGFTHERKALALAILGLFSSYFLLLMLIARTEMPEWFPAFAAMFGLYFVTFFSVASHWFWGRWVAIGVGTWGATIAIWGIITTRELQPALVILGLTHGLVALLLMGSSMGAHYEGRTDWRARFGLDEDGVKRLRSTVTRAASSIPALVLFALAPRGDDAAVVALCVVLGLGTLLLGRTIGLAGLVAAAAGTVGLVAFAPAPVLDAHGLMPISVALPQAIGVYAAVALFAAVAPFVGPIGRYLKR